MVKIILIALILIGCAALGYAQTFYEDDGRGYYQYYTPAPKEDNTSKKYIRPVVPSDEVLYKMPTEEFQKLFTDTLNYALTERNLDTYGDYVKMSTMANTRANEFGSLQVMYAQLHPVDENLYTRSVNQDAVQDDISRVLRQNKDTYGFIYFYSPTCAYCAKTSPLIEMFQNRHGWEVEWINVLEKPALTESLGITTTPSVRMIDRQSNITPISNGLITLPEIEERAYRFIRYYNGETTDTNFGSFATAIR